MGAAALHGRLGLRQGRLHGLSEAGRPNHQGRIERHDVLLRLGALSLEHRLENAGVVLELAAAQGLHWSKAEAQGLGIQALPLHLAASNQAQLAGTRERGFIQSAMAKDHHRTAAAQAGQCISHGIEQIRRSDPEDLEVRPKGIHQGTQEVEDRPHPEGPAQWGQSHQRRMPARGKQKAHPSRVQGLNHLMGWRFEVQTDGFEHVGGAHLAAGAAVAMLRHLSTTGGSDEGHSG